MKAGAAARKPCGIVQRDVGGRPATGRPHAAGVLQRREELVAQKGHFGARQGIPGLRIELIDTGVLAGEHDPLMRRYRVRLAAVRRAVAFQEAIRIQRRHAT